MRQKTGDAVGCYSYKQIIYSYIFKRLYIAQGDRGGKPGMPDIVCPIAQRRD